MSSYNYYQCNSCGCKFYESKGVAERTIPFFSVTKAADRPECPKCGGSVSAISKSAYHTDEERDRKDDD